MENILILRSPYKIPRAYLNPARDPKTNRYPASVRRVDKNGDMILSREDIDSGGHFISEIDVIEIWDGKVFDLDDEFQASEWEAIKYHKIIAKGRDERDDKGNLIIDGDAKKYGNADWYVEIPGKEAVTKNQLRRKKLEAQNYILSDTPEDRLLKARVLGKAMRNAHDSDVEDYLMKEAEKNPDKIINLYTGGDMKIRITFLKAKDEKVITFRDKLWLYGDNILGATEEADILWMKQPSNKKILKLIEQEVYPEMFEQPKK